MLDGRSLAAVDAAHRYGDGEASREELEAYRHGAREAMLEARRAREANDAFSYYFPRELAALAAYSAISFFGSGARIAEIAERIELIDAMAVAMRIFCDEDYAYGAATCSAESLRRKMASDCRAALTGAVMEKIKTNQTKKNI
jgi:hypothetical protein